MTQFKFRNLPRGFEFLLGQQEIREFVKSVAANFELVEFASVGYGEGKRGPHWGSSLHFPCRLKADWREGEGQEGEWVFRCEFEGIKAEHFEGRREEIKREVLNHIRRWVEGKLAIPYMAPKKACSALVSFHFSENGEEIVSLSERD